MDSSEEITLALTSDDEPEDVNGTSRKESKKKNAEIRKILVKPITITSEEIEFREKNFSEIDIEKLKLLCTSCAKSLELNISHFLIHSHPFLEVLLCKGCSDFYGEGDFSVDEDGTDKYCRWCGQGGTLYLCSDCNFGFCRACIKRNLHRSVLKAVDSDDWKCFSCDSKPLWELRGICDATLKYVILKKDRRKRAKALSKLSKKAAMFSTSESEDEKRNMKDGIRKKRKMCRSPSLEKSKKKKHKANGSENMEMESSSQVTVKDIIKYSRKVDRETVLDVSWAEELISKYEEHSCDFFDVVNAITSEAKKVFKKKKLSVQRMEKFEGRHDVLKKMIELRDLSCKSITQACENFVLSYRHVIEQCINESPEKVDTTPENNKSSNDTAVENLKANVNDEKVSEKDDDAVNNLNSEDSESDGKVSEKDVEKGDTAVDNLSLEGNKSVAKGPRKDVVKDDSVVDNLNSDDDKSVGDKSEKRDSMQQGVHESADVSDKEAEKEDTAESNLEAEDSQSLDDSSEEREKLQLHKGKENSCVNKQTEDGNSDEVDYLKNKESESKTSSCRKAQKSYSNSISDINCDVEIHEDDGDALGSDSDSAILQTDHHLSHVNGGDSNSSYEGNERSNIDTVYRKRKVNKGRQKSSEQVEDILSSVVTNFSVEDSNCQEKSTEKVLNDSDDDAKDVILSDSSEAMNSSVSSKKKSVKMEKNCRSEIQKSKKKSADTSDNSDKEKMSVDELVSESNAELKTQSSENIKETSSEDSFSDTVLDSDSENVHSILTKKLTSNVTEGNTEKIVDDKSKENFELHTELDTNANNVDSSSEICHQFSDNDEAHSDISVPSKSVLPPKVQLGKDNSCESQSEEDGSEKLSASLLQPSYTNSNEDANKTHIRSKHTSKKKYSKSEGTYENKDNKRVKGKKGIKNVVDCDIDDHNNDNNSDKIIVKENKRTVLSEDSDNDQNSNNEIKNEEAAKSTLLMSSSDDEMFFENEKGLSSNNNSDVEDSESLKSSSDKDSKGKNFEAFPHSDESNCKRDLTIKVKSDKKEAILKLGSEHLSVRNCNVVIKKLPQDIFQKYYNESSYPEEGKKKQQSEKDQIDKLTNLKTLDVSSKKKVSSASDSDNSQKANVSLKKVLKKQVKKKDKETLKDFHNSDSDAERKNERCSNNSDHSDNSDELNSKPGLKNIFKELSKKNNKLAKELLLRSSSSDSDGETNENNEEKEGKKVKKTKAKKSDIDGKEEKVVKKEKSDDEKSVEKGKTSDDSDDNIKKKAAWRNDKLLRMKLSESDTSDDERRWNARKLKDAKVEEKDRKKTRKPRIVHSDSDPVVLSSESSDTDSDEIFQPVNKKKRKNSTGSDKSKSNKTDSDSDKSQKKKPKRRRIRRPASDSSDSDGGNKNGPNSQKSDGTPNKGRKNIRRVLKEDDVAEETRKAAKEEEERRKRIAEKQKLYNELYNVYEKECETVDKLILDFDPETKKELVKVDENLVKKLKPHQVKGVKFMWDACFESLEHIKKNDGSGCILAHCMGLGKTLQVVTLVHTLLTNRKSKIDTVMVVCPLSTVLNWVNEFSKWCDQLEDNDIEVYELTKYKQVYEKIGVLKHWHKNGGVLIIGYNLYRSLTTGNSKRQKKRSKEVIQETLVDPGPDLVVCDEGHLLKNQGSALSKAMNLLRTQRRIVLTGTPLQNNLLEYHCMVQFVKPNLLGTKKEFLNRFVNPINNGQYENSTAHDVKIMKRRAHVLHKMLDSSVQRYDYSVLTPFLPPKFEYALSIRLTEKQIKLYRYYLDQFGAPLANDGSKTKTATLFKDYQALSKIWTHPRVLLMNSEKADQKRSLESESEDSRGSLRDFIADSDSTSESSDSDVQEVSGEENSKSKKPSRRPRTRGRKTDSNDGSESETVNCEGDEEKSEYRNPEDWWRQFITNEDDLDDIRESGKLCLLFTLLDECDKIGDKVLVFSQSLFSLNLIEYFLQKIDEANQKGEKKDNLLGYTASWSLGLDYFRLDGSSSPENRSAWCNAFNRDSNMRARLFLISTRAGGLGINLVAANRVVIFDASWNPSHDLQSIFRVYRFGQKKPCYIYRFLAQATMEEKIYNRQVTKLSLACRVVDEQQIERHYSLNALQELYIFNPEEKNNEDIPLVPKDILLAELVRQEDTWIITYHEHDTLLENKEEEELNEEERKAAWEDYEKEKQGLRANVTEYGDGAFMAYLNRFGFTEHAIRDNIVKQNPNYTEIEIQAQMSTVLRQLYAYVSSEDYHRKLQMQQFKRQQTQPVYLHNPHMQPHIQVNMQPQANPYSHLSNVQVQSNMQHQLQQPMNMQPSMQLNQNNTLDRLMVQQKENSNVPGTSASGTQRLKVKSFGQITNSNFASPPAQVYPNPFSSGQATFSQNGGDMTQQRPRTAKPGSTGAKVIDLD